MYELKEGSSVGRTNYTGIKIWLDDIRPPPYDYYTWVKRADTAVLLIKEGEVVEISFDHDLGDVPLSQLVIVRRNDGYAVAQEIERLACLGELKMPIGWGVHSSNLVGRDNIARAMTMAEKRWEQQNIARPQEEL